MRHVRETTGKGLVLLLGVCVGAGAWVYPGRAEDPSRDLFGDPLPVGAVARLGSTRFRHSDRIWDLVFSPDGKSVISSGLDETVRFWDVKTGRQTRLASRPASSIVLALSPDGATLAVCDENGSKPGITLLNTATATEQQFMVLPKEFAPHPGHGPRTVAFSPDGKQLASVKPTGEVCLLDLTRGKVTAVLGQHEHSNVPVLVFSPDGRILASSAQDKTIRLWDVAGRKALFVLRSEDTTAFPLVFSRDGKWLISGGGTQEAPDDWRSPWGNPAIRVWDVATGKQLRVFRDAGVRGAIRSLALAPDGRTLAASCNETLRLWDVTTGKVLRSLPGTRDHHWQIVNLHFSPDGKILAGGLGSMVGLWDVTTGRLLNLDDEQSATSIASVAMSHDGRLLAGSDGDGYLSLWDFRGRRLIRRFRGHDSSGRRVAFSPDDKTLASISEYGRVRAWDVADGRQRYQFPLDPPEDSRPTELAFSPDGKLLAYAYFSTKQQGGPRGIRLLDAATGAERQNLTLADAVHGRFAGIGFSPDGDHLMGTTVDGMIYGWRRESDRFVPKGLSAFDAHGCSVAYGDRGFLSVDWISGKVLSFRDFETGKTLSGLPEFPRLDNALAISRDGRYVASGLSYVCGDNAGEARNPILRVCEMASGQEVLRWHLPPNSGCRALTFAPDGRALVAGMMDTTVLVWDLVPAGQVAAHEMPALWADLAGNDAAKAYRAKCRLIAAPSEALALLRRYLQPVKGMKEKDIQRLIADLDADEFAVREKATVELRQLGELAEPACRKTLTQRPSLEMKRRLQGLLDDMTSWRAAPEMLRQLRALEVLECIGTPEARTVLQSLAEGAAGARLTREARAAVHRLKVLQGAKP